MTAIVPRASERVRVEAIDQDTAAFLGDVESWVLGHRAVEHPFLNDYRINGGSPETDRLIFSECYYYFRHLPFYIPGIVLKTRDERILREVLLTTLDEVMDDPTHSALYLQFMAGIGLDRAALAAYAPLPTTIAMEQGVRGLYVDDPLVESLGALFADESMSAVMVSKLNDGLAVSGRDEATRYFWILHVTAEVGHSNSIYNAIAPQLETAVDRQAFLAGAERFLALLEAYWDGIAALVAQRTGGARA
jgi:pyrroloquinoline-quinone synthase